MIEVLFPKFNDFINLLELLNTTFRFIISIFETAVGAFIGTLIPSLIAWFIYSNQISKSKKNAAMLVYIEVRYMFNTISALINTNQMNYISTSFSCGNSWTKNKSLLTDEFHEDEILKITTLYNIAESLELARNTVLKNLISSTPDKNEDPKYDPFLDKEWAEETHKYKLAGFASFGRPNSIEHYDLVLDKLRKISKS